MFLRTGAFFSSILSEFLKNLVALHYDEALANAYVVKTGKPKNEILQLMNKETWLTAERAVELGFVDAVAVDAPSFTNACSMMAVTPEMLKEFQDAKAKEKALEEEKENLLKDLDLYGV